MRPLACDRYYGHSSEFNLKPYGKYTAVTINFGVFNLHKLDIFTRMIWYPDMDVHIKNLTLMNLRYKIISLRLTWAPRKTLPQNKKIGENRKLV